jgi:hypothetical protein
VNVIDDVSGKHWVSSDLEVFVPFFLYPHSAFLMGKSQLNISSDHLRGGTHTVARALYRPTDGPCFHIR